MFLSNYKEFDKLDLLFISRIFILFFSIILFYIGLVSYPGSKILFILFSLVSNLYILLSLTYRSFFFDIFISIFFWLGFYLKFIIQITFRKYQFSEAGINIQYSIPLLNKVLIISSVGILAFLLSLIIKKFFFFNHKDYKNKFIYLEKFYFDYKKKILFFFVFSILVIAYINFSYSIYQKGIRNNENNIFLTIFFGWLVLFGFSSFTALILSFEIKNKNNWIYLIFSFCENIVSAFSMLSRSFFFNFFSILIGYLYKSNFKNKKNFFINISVILALFFVIFFIYKIPNYLRSVNSENRKQSQIIKDQIIIKDNNNNSISAETLGVKDENVFNKEQSNNFNLIFNLISKNSLIYDFFLIATDRFVGIDGVISVVNYHYKNPQIDNWQMYHASWKEKFNPGNLSFYDTHYVYKASATKEELNIKLTHQITIPGFIAHTYISGSVFFLFFVCFILNLVIYFFEFNLNKYTSNIILTSLFSQILAYRLIHFGYVPSQSYLLIVAIILNILIIIFLNYLLNIFYDFKKK
jgi:hypothetical protein